MIVDTSAFVTIAFEESGWRNVSNCMDDADVLVISAANYVELYMVIEGRRHPELTTRVNKLLDDADVEIVTFTISQAHIARSAFLKYGRGSGSKAKLNFGDCIAYALAKETGEPLLFVGNDFIHTDIIPALDPPVLASE
ncbi:MAG: type II toxin-antitoxin system VapC family toxin [Thermomicrobiales bacterium]